MRKSETVFDFSPTLMELEEKRALIAAAIDAVHKVMGMYPSDVAPSAGEAEGSRQTEKKTPYAKSEAKRLTVFWTPERLDELWAMRERGVKVRQIADHFDTSDQTIYNQVTRLKKERCGSSAQKKTVK